MAPPGMDCTNRSYSRMSREHLFGGGRQRMAKCNRLGNPRFKLSAMAQSGAHPSPSAKQFCSGAPGICVARVHPDGHGRETMAGLEKLVTPHGMEICFKEVPSESNC